MVAIVFANGGGVIAFAACNDGQMRSPLDQATARDTCKE
jgi:hypothetical protein